MGIRPCEKQGDGNMLLRGVFAGPSQGCAANMATPARSADGRWPAEPGDPRAARITSVLEGSGDAGQVESLEGDGDRASARAGDGARNGHRRRELDRRREEDGRAAKG